MGCDGGLIDRRFVDFDYPLLDYKVGQHLPRHIGVNVSRFDSHNDCGPPGEPRRDCAPVVVVGRIVRCVIIIPSGEAAGGVLAGWCAPTPGEPVP